MTNADQAGMLNGGGCECLSDAYHAMGDEGRALSWYKRYITLRDSAFGQKNTQKVGQLRARYEFSKVQLADSIAHAGELLRLEDRNTIERLRADRNRNRALGLGGSALLLLTGGSAFFISDRKRRKARFEKDAAQLETQALRSQMNPHFIFNALNSINAFVQTNERDKASDYLARFARLMRMVLENSRHAEVPLKDDLDALRGYLELERTRTNERFDYSIEVDSAVDQEQLLVPPLVLQPFVENAIWHGMAGRTDKGRITLKISRRGEDIVMMVEDDGRGRLAPKAVMAGMPEKKSSLGTAITKARLDLIGKQKGRPAGFTYTDLPEGTRVEVTLPMGDAA
jgi:two-component sensor histidine kinase